jgi:magnesium transporter
MTDVGEGRALPRALQAPVRAMSRMLGAAQNGDPQSLPPDAPEQDAIVSCDLYLGGERQPGPQHYADALAAAGAHKNGFIWLALTEPTARQFAGIAETFQLHELAVEDAVKSAQRPKVERYGEMTFAALRTAQYCEHEEFNENSQVVETGDILMFIGPQYVITVRHGKACELSQARLQLDRRPDLLRHGPWAVAYAVYDLIVDGFLDVAGALEEDISDVEEYAFARHARGRIQRIYGLKRELMEFRRAVLPLQRPLTSLVGSELTGEMRRYFRDVNDHLTRAGEQVVYFDDLLNSILQARLAQVTVDQNNDMRKIAAWASIAVVWTAIAGVYGMNFAFMPELKWRYGYPVVWAIMLGTSIMLYRAYRRSGWL